MIKRLDLVEHLEILSKYCLDNKLKLFVVLSSSVEDEPYSYFGGVRVTSLFISTSLINITQQELTAMGSTIDMHADYIAVDTEKKHPFSTEINENIIAPCLYSNLLTAAHKVFSKEKIIPWSPSRLTAESTLNKLRGYHNEDLSGHHVTLVGAGSIGFKVALGLVEEGCNVHLYARDNSRSACLVSAINYIKSKYTISAAIQATSIETAVASSSCLVITASSKGFLSPKHLMYMPRKHHCNLLDVGKNSLDNDAITILDRMPNVHYSRLDISRELILFLCQYCGFESIINESSFQPLRKPHPTLDSTYMVSGGFPGKPGDLIVDNAEEPKFILGHISGDNQFISAFSLFANRP